MRAVCSLTILVAVLLLQPSVTAHNVWCHCPKTEAAKTLAFFHKAGEVYEALSDAMLTWHSANSPLEKGVLAEFERAVNKTALKPYHYQETLHALNALTVKTEVLQIKLTELRALAAAGDTTPEFDTALTKIRIWLPGQLTEGSGG